MPDIVKPGVRNAVTASTIAPTSHLTISCPILKRCVLSTFSANHITSFQRIYENANRRQLLLFFCVHMFIPAGTSYLFTFRLNSDKMKKPRKTSLSPAGSGVFGVDG